MPTMETTLLSCAQIARLMEIREDTCLSLYLTPTPAGDAQQSPIRLKNLVREAEEKLQGSNPEVLRRLRDAGELLNSDAEGLALFLTADHAFVYPLPFPVEEKLVVDVRFHLKPLLWYYQYRGRFYVVALNKRQSRLLECSIHGEREVKLPGEVPRGLEDVLATEEVPDGTMQLRTGKSDVHTFISQFQKSVEGKIADNCPLVLAGAPELVSAYRQTSSHEALLLGNPAPEDLREEALKLMEPEFLKERDAVRARLELLEGRGERSMRNIRDIVPAAAAGRVEALLIPDEAHILGRFDRQDHKVYLGQTGEDLLDLAALFTLENRGQVFLFEAGSLGAPGAILRY